MKQRRAVRLFRALLFFASLAALPALAQGTAVFTGTVTDAATHKPVADVVVTATSPNLQGEQVVVTDDKGDYRIPQLPPGVYTLNFNGPGYKPFNRAGIELRLDQTIRFNVPLLPETAGQETIEVVGRTPTIDVTSTSTGVNVDTNFMRNIPLVLPGARGGAARSFESIAQVAPGAHADTYGTSISGTTSPENGYVIDGVSVNDPSFGTNGSQMSVEFVQEVNVNTGGYLPEYGRATGGVISVQTKSGSNEFHGSVFGNITPGIIATPGTEIPSAGGTVTGTRRLWNLGDFGAELGGPILKDKLWFYVGVAPSFTRYQLESNWNSTRLDANGDPMVDANGNPVTDRIPGTTRFFFADQRTIQYIAKLTYNISQDHSIAISVFGSPTSSGGPGKFSLFNSTGTPETGTTIDGTYESFAHLRDSNVIDTSLKYSGSFMEKRFLVDATIGYHAQDSSIRAVDGTKVGEHRGLADVANVLWDRSDPGLHSLLDFENLADPSYCDPAGTPAAVRCPVVTYTTGGPGGLSETHYDRWQGKLIGTYLLDLLGKHVLKAGLDLEMTHALQQNGLSGRVAYAEADDGSYFQDFRQFGYLSGPDQPHILDYLQADSVSMLGGAFVQDSWNLFERLTVNVGVRYDQQQLIGGGKVAINLGNEWSPRLGLIYDFTGQGRSKVYASYARYYEAVPLDLVNRGFPGERQVISLKDSAVCDPRTLEGQKGPCQSDEARFPWRSALDANQLWAQTGGGQEAVDPALNPQASDEILAGVEYEVLENLRAGVSYTRRTQASVIEDMSRDDGATYFIGNPGNGFAKDFPTAIRNYDAVTLYLNKAFRDLWLAQISYTYSSLTGNWEGLFRADTGQLDPNINSDFDLVSLLPNRVGPLPGDTNHSIKLFAAKEFVISGNASVNIGGGYSGSSGAPTNYLGAHLTYGPGEAFILPRGSGERMPWIHRIDGRIGLNYKLSKDITATLSADVFNVFNFQAVTAIDENYTFSAVLPVEGGKPSDLPGKLLNSDETPFDPVNKNPNFGKPIAYQSPRSFRFGVRVTF